MKNRLLLSLLLLAFATAASAQPSFGTSRLLNDGWLFQLAPSSSSFSAARNLAETPDSSLAAPAFDDSRWQHVLLPHDWSVTQPMSPDCGSCQGYLPGGIGWYRRHLNVSPADLADGRRLYIYFEGVYNRSSVYLNGHLLGYRPSGFASFLYDLTPYLQPGADNVLALQQGE